MKKQKLNVRLLRRIQKHITEEPRRFFMGHFYAKGQPGKRTWDDGSYCFAPSDLARQVPACGTAACIAGWANIMTGVKVGPDVSNVPRASKKLGLDTVLDSGAEGFGYLFWVSNWPEPFSSSYQEAKTPKQRAKIACQRIDHLIKTGQ